MDRDFRGQQDGSKHILMCIIIIIIILIILAMAWYAQNNNTSDTCSVANGNATNQEKALLAHNRKMARAAGTFKSRKHPKRKFQIGSNSLPGLPSGYNNSLPVDYDGFRGGRPRKPSRKSGFQTTCNDGSQCYSPNSCVAAGYWWDPSETTCTTSTAPPPPPPPTMCSDGIMCYSPNSCAANPAEWWNPYPTTTCTSVSGFKNKPSRKNGFQLCYPGDVDGIYNSCASIK